MKNAVHSLACVVVCLCSAGAFAAGLPSGYEARRYLNFPGDKWLEVPRTFSTQGMGYSVCATPTTEDSHILSSADAIGPWAVYRSSLMLRYNGAEKDYTTAYTKKTTTQVDFNVAGDNKVFINGVEAESWAGGTSYSASGTMYIGTYGGSPSTSDYLLKGRFYFLKTYSNGALTMDLVPCVRTSDSQAGLYDVNSSEPDAFYFTAGITAADAVDESVLIVDGEPVKLVAPDCGYGEISGFAAGARQTITAPQTSIIDGKRVECVGWTLYKPSVDSTGWTAISSDESNVCEYTHPDPAVQRKLVFHWRVTYRVHTERVSGGIRACKPDQYLVLGDTGSVQARMIRADVTPLWKGNVTFDTYTNTAVSFTVDRPLNYTLGAVERFIIFESYLSGSWQRICDWEGTIEDLSVYGGKMNGNAIDEKDGLGQAVFPHISDGVMTVQFQYVDNKTWLKVVFASFKVENGGLYVKGNGTTFTDAKFTGDAGTKIYRIPGEIELSQTSGGVGGYNVHDLIIPVYCPPDKNGLVFLVK